MSTVQLRHWSKQPKATRRSPNFTHLTDLANRALVLRVVSRPIEGTGNTRRTAVYGRVRGSADIELGELVEFDVDLVLRTSLAHSLDFTSLRRTTR